MFIKELDDNDNIYITYCDILNHFRYVPFKQNGNIIVNNIIGKNYTQVIHVPKWIPNNDLFLKPYLYYKSLPTYFYFK
jgi:hypothetical protein